MKFKNSSIFLGLILTYCLQTNAAPSSKNYTEIKTRAQFESALASNKPQIIKFYTPWCGSCKHIEPTFNDVAFTHFDKAEFSALDIDNKEFDDLKNRYRVTGVPTIIAFKSGREIKREDGVGSSPKQDLENLVKSLHATEYSAKPAPVKYQKPKVVENSTTKAMALS